jgi:hypothetical protein
MIQNETQMKSLVEQRIQIMNRIKNENPTNKWLVLGTKYGKNTLSVFFVGTSGCLTIWFINNLINNRSLLGPSLFDISGVEWVWSPELLGMAVLFYFMGVSLQKPLAGNTLRLAGFGAITSFAIFVNLTLFTPTTLAFQSNIQTDYNKLGYRVFSRDNHVKMLMDTNTYYGIVATQTPESIIINHGGINKKFTVSKSIPDITKKIIQITFDKEFKVSSYTILDN